MNSHAIQQRKARAEFELTNTGITPRQIRFDHANCGCVKVELDGAALQSGATFDLQPGVTRVFATQSSAGAAPTVITQHADLTAGDLPSDSFELSATKRIFADTEMSGGSLVCQFYPGEAASQRTIEIKRAYRSIAEPKPIDPKLLGLPVSFKPGAWKLESLEHIATDLWRETWQLELTLTPPADSSAGVENFTAAAVFNASEPSPSGRGQGEGDADLPRPLGEGRGEEEGNPSPPGRGQGEGAASARVDIPIILKPRTGVEGPKLVHFGETVVGTKYLRRILIRAVDDKPFRIAEASSTSSAVTVQYDHAKSAMSHWLEIEFTPSETGKLASQVTIKTTHEVGNELHIDIMARAVTHSELAATQ